VILIACGTHHQPFDRLVRAAAAVAGAGLGRVVVQRGASRVPAPGCEVHDEVPPAEFRAWLQAARIVVLHAGSSSFLEARSLGRTPILVPRCPVRGEHVDDHQVRFAESVAEHARVTSPEELPGVLRTFVEPPHRRRGPTPFAERFAALVAAWHPDTPSSRR